MEKSKYSKIKWLMSGCLSGVVLVFLLGFSLQFFARETDEQTLKNALASISQFINESKNNVETGKRIDYFYQENASPYIAKMARFPEGDIVFATTKNQMMWIHFSFSDNRLTIDCFGSPPKIVSENCPH